ncbi:GNAT family N-acetyltransferase [Furfurilactobacillus siliginis]|nr:GNAT family N-acetyltransferase [Furfurilactobacillus siliginis]GEK29593.1 hypothetical protein LSI01_19040 [Furfurilactobacillus siliginis]
MKTDTYHYFALPDADKQAIDRLSNVYWPGITDDPERIKQLREYYEQIIVLVMYDDDGKLVGSVKMPSTTIFLNQQRYHVTGLSEVMIDPAYRHKGFGISLIMTAYALIQHDDADFTIFTCTPDLVPFYEQGGWQSSPQTVLIGGSAADPIASDKIGTVAMMSFFTPAAMDNQAEIEKSTIQLNVGEKIMW